jgi:topoisomerase-4 subunit B
MYTDTTRPNHLAQEVIDNSVDEAIAGHASAVTVILYADGSLSVEDDGRGMPVDMHPEEGIPGVELILTRLHAGGKFSDRNYRFSGGLHGVGVSVVNALSSRLEVWVKRNGKEYHMAFAGGDKVSDLEEVGTAPRRVTGTTVRFWPDPRYFDSPKFSTPRLKHVLRAKAVLCPGLKVAFTDEASGEQIVWHYEDGFTDYLKEALGQTRCCPIRRSSAMSAASARPPTGPCLVAGGRRAGGGKLRQPDSHAAGRHPRQRLARRTDRCGARVLRVPQPGAARAAHRAGGCLGRLLLRAVGQAGDPQFSGQTKERLSSRECAVFVAGVVKDTLSLWLNQHPETGERIAQLALANAQKRLRASRKVVRKQVTSGPALPGKLADCTAQDWRAPSCFWWRAIPPAVRPNRPATASFRR